MKIQQELKYKLIGDDKIEGGRDVVAVVSMKKGDMVFEEQSFASIPLLVSTTSVQLCMMCCKDTSDEQQKIHLTDCTYGCGYSFCSETCSSDIVHQLECSFVKRVGQAANQHSVDLRLSLLVLRILIKKHIENERFVESVGQLSIQKDRFKETNPKWLDSYYKFADTFMELIKSDGVDPSLLAFFDREEVTNIACALLINSFASTKDHIQTSNGFFYQAALLNHSCLPNTFFSIIGDKLTMRSIKDIENGSNIYDSYVDLLLPTFARQQLLMKSKNFFCQCKRCSDPTEDGIHFTSIKCPTCNTETEPIEEIVNPSQVKTKTNKNSSIPASSFIYISPCITKSNNNQQQLEVQWKCSNCSIKQQEFDGIIKSVEALEQFVESKLWKQDHKSFLEQAPKLYANVDEKIHENHHVRLGYHLGMCNAQVKAEQVTEAIYHAKRVKRIVKRVLRSDRGEMVDCYGRIGDLFERLFIECVAQRQQARERKLDRIVTPETMKTLLAHAHKNFIKGYHLSIISYGPSHPRTIQFQSSIKKSMIIE